MSAGNSDELSALLALEGAPPLSLQAIDDEADSASAQTEERQGIGQDRENSGRAIQAERTIPAALLTAAYRERICALALPALTQGATLAEVAADCGTNAPTLRGWLISIDEPAYREALAGQIGAKLARHEASMDSCIAQSEDAMRRTLTFETVSISGGQHDKDVLVGPVIAKVAQSRASILSDAARLLHWQAEKRLPKLFTTDEAAGAGPVRASFSFIINGQPAPGGRILQVDSSNNEQGVGSAPLLDIIPVARSVSAIPTLSDGVIPNSMAEGADPSTRDPTP